MTAPVVLITGALAGIGRATALAFARQGARLVVSGRRDDAGQALAGELRELGVEAAFIRADVRHEADVEALVAGTLARFGRLDVAVNNAGTEGTLTPLTELDVGDRARIVSVYDEDPDRLRYLGQLGLVPGVIVTLVSRQPYGGPLSLRFGEAVRDIGPALGACVFAERLG